MNFNLFELFKQTNATKDVVTNSVVPKASKQCPPPLMPQEQWDKYWPELEATKNWKKREFRIGMAIYETYPDIDLHLKNVLRMGIAEIVANSEDKTKLVISQIREKEKSPEQILEDLKKNMTVGNAVGVSAPAPPINLGQIILSMTDAEVKASWEKREAIENWKKREFRIGMAIYETYPEMDEHMSNMLEINIAEIVADSEDQTQSVISKIRTKEQHPEQILEDLKKNMKVDNVVGVNSPAP